MQPRKVRVIRDVDVDESHNFAERDVWAGNIL